MFVQIARNKCIDQTVFGKTIRFCCCNTGDLCNSRNTNASIFDQGKQKVKDFFTGMVGNAIG